MTFKINGRKTAVFLSLLFAFSCSKDDDNSLPINQSNMLGKWNIKSVIKADGSTINYVGSCPSQKDYIELLLWGEIVENRYIEDCVTMTQTFCDSFNLNDDNVINTSCSDLDEGEVTSLSRSSFRIEYPEPINFYFMNIYAEDAKVIIFEKRE